MKIVIGSDHAAFEMKEFVREFLLSKKIDVIDVGTKSAERCDYPDYASALVKEVLKNKIPGILLCGSGIGVSIVANRYKGIRAALCRSPYDAEMARKHNDANVLCLGARTNSEEEIKAIIEAWMAAEFEGGRHLDRLNKFQDLGVSC
ncbi:MAG: ribose 5-phosphate isomerase B [Alphaproteobacteria bacterium]|nr:MAG: ribose 5-phosphate isomerase B [Alphaproteobacteria bacterium]